MARSRLTSRHATQQAMTTPIAISRLKGGSSGRQSANAKYGPANQMNTTISSRPIRMTKVRFRKANMAGPVVCTQPSRRWMISTRRLRARFSGADSGRYFGSDEPMPCHVRRAGLLIVFFRMFATLTARARDSSKLSWN